MNIYKKIIKELNSDNSVECIIESLEKFVENSDYSFEDILDFSDKSLKKWLSETNPELLKNIKTDVDEDILNEITNGNIEKKINLYAEYISDNNKIPSLIDTFKDLEYELSDLENDLYYDNYNDYDDYENDYDY